MSRTLKYVELCTGTDHNGPAWIGFAETSRSGRMVYFNGRAYARTTGGGVVGNAYDVESREFVWISGVKKRETNRHVFGSGRTSVSEDAVEALLQLKGWTELDESEYDVVPSFPPTDKERIRQLLNESICDEVDAV